MNNYAVYNLKTGFIYKTVSLPAQYKYSIRLEDGQGIVEIPRIANDINEIIYEGKLTEKPKTNKETQ